MQSHNQSVLLFVITEGLKRANLVTDFRLLQRKALDREIFRDCAADHLRRELHFRHPLQRRRLGMW